MTNRSVDIEPVALVRRFESIWADKPRVFRAPARVNLIGEHTDYNDGFVMPAAIDFSTWVAVAPRRDGILAVHSVQFGETCEFGVEVLPGPPRKHWTDYVRGVAAKLRPPGIPDIGANLVISGNVPIGAGLSSSAALEVATALALSSVWDRTLSRIEMAKLCQSAEHEYAGTHCGIMDQFISLHGKEGACLLLDCRSLEHRSLPVPKDARLVICNTKVKHQLANGEYNRRRVDCERAVVRAQKDDASVAALRDVTPELLESCKLDLSEVVYRRCRHVLSENERVITAAKALEAGNLQQFGSLMYESHNSLRRDYEVSCHELDLLVDIASQLDGVYGARMTGGGFGGCTINLVADDAVQQVISELEARYSKHTGILPEIYSSPAAGGAGEYEVQD